MADNFDYDILIIGGGMVGASLACALGEQPLRIAVIEAVPFRSQQHPSYDERSIALAYGSRLILEGMGLWPRLDGQVTPIKRIHVSDRGHFGMSHMDSRGSGCDALGYVVENRVLGNVLAERLEQLAHIEMFCPARLDSLDPDSKSVTAVIDQDGQTRSLTARLVIGADGSQSAVRKLTGIDARTWDYGQSAIIANVTPEHGHDFTAYERFTDSGPLALLPLTEQRCSLVWTVRTAEADTVMNYDDDEFLHRLQQRFGYRLGTFIRKGRHVAYPLTLMRASPHRQPRLALIGNAAHTLHPIAGQGLNLGIRDVAALAEVIVESLHKQRDIGSAHMLRQYDSWRLRDQRRIITLTDSLVRLFSNRLPPLVAARNLGMLVMDVVPPLKRQLLRHTMGLAGHLPRLARGLPL